jgi:hypothetical protein
MQRKASGRRRKKNLQLILSGRVKQNIEEGRGFKLMDLGKNQGGAI